MRDSRRLQNADYVAIGGLRQQVAVVRRIPEMLDSVRSSTRDDEFMKPAANVKTPAQYIASLPADRAKTIATVRALVNQHIPRGYDECIVWGTIGWTIPLSRYPDTYNKQPICYVALAAQKNYCSLYLMGAFWSATQLEQLKAEFKTAGKKLDMGKCCVHFRSPDDLPLEEIGKLIAAISSEQWIEMYEQSRLKTKAGQAKAKKGGVSARKRAAKGVGTKRGDKGSQADLGEPARTELNSVRRSRGTLAARQANRGR